MGLFDRFKKNKKQETPKAEPIKQEAPKQPSVQETKPVEPEPKQDEEPKSYDGLPFDMEIIKKHCIAVDKAHAEQHNSNKPRTSNNAELNINKIFANALIETEEKLGRKMTDDEIIATLNNFTEASKERAKRIEKENRHVTRWDTYCYKNNEKALEHIDNGEYNEAFTLFEKNVEVLSKTVTPYTYLSNYYRSKNDYDNEFRICKFASERLTNPKRRRYYKRRAEEVLRRKNNEGMIVEDKELFKVIRMEEESSFKSLLNQEYYKTEESKEENKRIREAKKEYLKKHPTNYLYMGTKIYGRLWAPLPYELDDEMEKLIKLAGEGKYLEESGNYEDAIAVYERANKIAKKQFEYRDVPEIDKRIKICNNKIRKQEIKKLEAEAKEMEKEDPKKAIELYDELNVLNPNLKKYNKRIEILKKKI